MSETNPFMHPARERFAQLLDEAEEMALEKTAAAPLHDPFQDYHQARDWGVDPWVLRMIEVDREMARLKSLAVDIAPMSEEAASAFKETAVGALQALVLFEEQAHGDPELDDQQLAAFLDRLVEQLDARLARLRGFAQPEDLPPPPAPKMPRRMEEPPAGPPQSEPPDRDPDVQLGLAFTDPHPALVAGEGSDGTPPASVDTGEWAQDQEDPDAHELTDEELARLDPRNLVQPSSEPLVQQTPLNGPGRSRRVDLVQVEEVDPADAERSHDFVREGDAPEDGEPVDLDAAERAHAREIIALKQTAAGSTGRQFQGRHASPEATDPDMGGEGKH